MYKSIVKARLMRRGHDGKTISFSPLYLHPPIYLFLFMCWSVGKPGNGCFSPHRDYVPIMYKKTSTKLQVIWFVANWHCHNPTSFLKSSTLCPFIWQLFHWSIHPDYKPLCRRVGWSVGRSRICSINNNNNNNTNSNRANPLPTGVKFFKIVNRWKRQESVEQHTLFFYKNLDFETEAGCSWNFSYLSFNCS